MFNSNEGYSLADIAAATSNKRDCGLGGDGGAWWIIILFLFCFAGWGGNGSGLFGGGSATASGITDGYVLTSDFASLQRQIDNATDGLRQQSTQIANGLSSLGYDQLGQMNGINTNINNAMTTLMAQINANEATRAQCCCETKNLINTNFATLNYNLADQSCQTRQTINDASAAIIANQDANTRSILDFLTQDKIATLAAENQSLKFAASQQAQNAYLVGALSPTPSPAYVVPNPYTGTYYGYGSTCPCNQ